MFASHVEVVNELHGQTDFGNFCLSTYRIDDDLGDIRYFFIPTRYLCELDYFLPSKMTKAFRYFKTIKATL